MAEPIKRDVTFTLTKLDLDQAMRLHVFSNYRQIKVIAKLTILWIVVVAGVTLLTYGDRQTWPERLLDVAPVALLFASVILAVIFGVPLLLGPLANRKRLSQDKVLRQPVMGSWDDASYVVIGENVQSRVNWRDYVYLREGSTVFTFATSHFTYQILPKRVLTHEQIDDIREIISKNRA